MNREAAQGEALPQGWRKMRLGVLSQFSKGSGITKAEVISEGVPCVRYGELYTKHNFRINEFYSFVRDKNSAEHKLIKNNDLLFAGSGETREEIGKCASFHHNVKAYAGGDVIICSIDPKILRADFASYYLNTIGRREINKLGQGDSIVHIYSRYLENIEIPVPPLPEQKAIASLLENWDTAIEKTEALITVKQRRFKWLLKTLISDQQDKPEWKKVPLDEIVKIRKEKYRPVDTKRLRRIELENIEKETARLIGETEFNQSLSTKYIFRRGDILFGKLRPNLRKFALPNFDGVCSSEIWVMCPDLEIADNKYFFYLIQSERFVNAACKTTGSRMPRADWSILKKLVFKVPSLTEQRTIASLLDTCSTEIEKNHRLIQYYQSQKRGLMQKLLTGEWRIG